MNESTQVESVVQVVRVAKQTNLGTRGNEIEWSCCEGHRCGYGYPNGQQHNGRTVYRLTGRRHPHITGAEVCVEPDGTLVRWWEGSRVIPSATVRTSLGTFTPPAPTRDCD